MVLQQQIHLGKKKKQHCSITVTVKFLAPHPTPVLQAQLKPKDIFNIYWHMHVISSSNSEPQQIWYTYIHATHQWRIFTKLDDTWQLTWWKIHNECQSTVYHIMSTATLWRLLKQHKSQLWLHPSTATIWLSTKVSVMAIYCNVYKCYPSSQVKSVSLLL